MENYMTKSGLRPEPVAYDMFTGGETKTADLTIYYNLALDNMGRIKQHIKTWPLARQHAYWAELLWKSHQQQKNSNGYEMTEADERIIEKLLVKVDSLRNFHSHIWHDNEVLAFDEELKLFVEKKYEQAKAALFAELPKEVMDYEQLEKNPKMKAFPLFKWVKGKRMNFITIEGRIFFLSFFLTTGQMNQLLQQRKGFKRSDMPLFKIKRLLYTYYCHRDGASLVSFNHDERFIDTMEEQDQKSIFLARTAYKLLSYLFDYPTYWGSEQDMPLFDESNEKIRSVEKLQKLISDSNVLPGLTFRLIERKQMASDEDMMEKQQEAHKKEQEDKFRLGAIYFTSEELPGFTFVIDFKTLHRLVVLQLLQQSAKQERLPADLLIENLKVCTENRVQLYNMLAKDAAMQSESDWDYLLDKKNQHLRGGRRLTELGITFFESMEKGKTHNVQERITLANYLRRADALWLEVPVTRALRRDLLLFEPEPIHVYQQDFVLGTSQKFRADNNFMYYVSKYLMDFGGNDCYWGMEKFEMGKKDAKAHSESLIKKKVFLRAADIPVDGDYRLTIENDHIYWAMPKNENASTNHDRFHQFSIGRPAMRYLVAALLNDKDGFNRKWSSFLKLLAEDLGKLQAYGSFKEEHGYGLVEKHFVSNYLHEESVSLDRLFQMVKSRIQHIVDEWNKALANKMYMSRSEKNRLIMDAYRLFDWPQGDDGNPRFFRAMEFNQMSVCHYSLHKRQSPLMKNGRNSFYERKSKLDYLFEDLFELNKRKPPIPYKILALVKRAESLDDLMELVIADRTASLREKERNLESWRSLPVQHQKKELPTMCRSLGISVPANILREQDRERLKQKHQTTLQVQRFAIHPMLVVKHFFPEHYDGGKPKDDKRTALPILGNVRKNQLLRDRLFVDFYDAEKANMLYPATEQKKQREGLIGLMDTTCTEDIMLWWIANEYLSNNVYTKDMGEYIKKQRRNATSYVSEFHKMAITIPLKQENSASKLYMQLLMHQLDDLIFRMQKDRLGKAAAHYLHRFNNEKTLWEAELIAMPENCLIKGQLPDGTVNKPMPFQLLINEFDLVRRTGQELARHMLDFEKRILQDGLVRHGSKNDFHNWLLQEYENSHYGEKFPVRFYNFESILSLANSLGKNISKNDSDLISKYRNITFHNDIPVEGSFSWMTRVGQPLQKILGVEKELHGKKDRSMYEVK